MIEWWMWPASFLIAGALVLFLFWLLRKLANWMLDPGDPPEQTAEPGTIAHDVEQFDVAVHELRTELSAALLPRLERIVQWIERRLSA